MAPSNSCDERTNKPEVQQERKPSFIQERAQLEQEWCELRNLKRAAQQERKPMTLEQREEVFTKASALIDADETLLWCDAVATVVEDFHGIKETP